MRAKGWSVIEDYRRILAISSRFNEIVKFIAKSGEVNTKASPEYQELQRLISENREAANQATDRNVKSSQRAQIKAFEEKVNELTKPQVNTVEPWLIDAMKECIDTFMPSRVCIPLPSGFPGVINKRITQPDTRR